MRNYCYYYLIIDYHEYAKLMPKVTMYFVYSEDYLVTSSDDFVCN